MQSHFEHLKADKDLSEQQCLHREDGLTDKNSIISDEEPRGNEAALP